MNERKAELVTTICKEIEKEGYSLQDTLLVFAAILEYHFQNKKEGQ